VKKKVTKKMSVKISKEEKIEALAKNYWNFILAGRRKGLDDLDLAAFSISVGVEGLHKFLDPKEADALIKKILKASCKN